MIIESAFLKIPEVLLSSKLQDQLYEANITNLLTTCVLLELNARNIENPLMKIDMERRYDMTQNIRCDAYYDFSDFMNESSFNGYGIRCKNWVESKYFGSIRRNKGNETKSENAGSIMYDIFRLIFHNHITGNTNDSKYSVNIFNDNPQKYLAYNRKDGVQRYWVEGLVKEGINLIKFDLGKEPNTIKGKFKGHTNIVMQVILRNTVFKPYNIDELNTMGFYGFLNQILDYKVEVDGVVVESETFEKNIRLIHKN